MESGGGDDGGDTNPETWDSPPPLNIIHWNYFICFRGSFIKAAILPLSNPGLGKTKKTGQGVRLEWCRDAWYKEGRGYYMAAVKDYKRILVAVLVVAGAVVLFSVASIWQPPWSLLVCSAVAGLVLARCLDAEGIDLLFASVGYALLVLVCAAAGPLLLYSLFLG